MLGGDQMLRKLLGAVAASSLLAACDAPFFNVVDTPTPPPDPTSCIDEDGDGYGRGGGCTGVDCDDSDEAINPEAADGIGDGVDNNCDGVDGTDADDDGYARGPDDCDDTVGSTYLGASDLVGDAVDNNCDGIDGVDADGDQDASLGSGGDDCDDTNAAINSGASDLVGDSVDNNCDGIDGTDGDGDGHASVGTGGDDCEDNIASTYPGASDNVGDGIDNNCDGADGVDADGDTQASEASLGTDCDDTDENVYFGAPESDDGIDQDCDDDALEAGQFDGDQDGYTAGYGTLADPTPDVNDLASSCTTDYTDTDGDGAPDCLDLCDEQDGDNYGVDTSANVVGAGTVSIGACTTNGSSASCAYGDLSCLGSDCDDNVGTGPFCHDGCIDYFPDADLDGFGVPGTTISRCPGTTPAGYASNADDVDDAASSCTDNLADSDADGAPDCIDLCIDLDGDGETADPATNTVGSGSIPVSACTTDGVSACTFQGPSCTPGTDCDDDPITGAGCQSGCVTAYRDVDGDGMGDVSFVAITCGAVGGFVTTPGDLNDAASSCTDDPIDSDGDGVEDCLDRCIDFDGDDFGTQNAAATIGTGAAMVGLCTSDGTAPCVYGDIDCTPGADCDDNADTGGGCNSGCVDVYQDHDGDGFGNAAVTLSRCGPPTGYSSTPGDIDDAASSCTDDASDDDNDAVPDCLDLCDDVDGDNYGIGRITDIIGTGADTVGTCTSDGTTACAYGDLFCLGIDCDDTPTTGAACFTGCFSHYPDIDLDGFGDSAAAPFDACEVIPGVVQDNSDLDDAASSCTNDLGDTDGDGVPDCLDLCHDIDEDDFGVDDTGTIVGAGAIAIEDCTTDGVWACPGLDDACIGTDLDDAASSCTDDLSNNDGDTVIDCLDGCLDVDGDGHGVDMTSIVIGGGTVPVGACTTNGSTPCTLGAALCVGSADCDDSAASGASCYSGCQTFYPDADQDTFGDVAGSADFCVPLAGYVGNNSDLDDSRSSCTDDLADSDGDTHPDCIDRCSDVDGDQYGVDLASTVVGSGAVAVADCTTDGATPCSQPDDPCLGTDCDDTGESGGTCHTGCTAHYPDVDRDGFGDAAAASFDACGVGPGVADNNTDLDDGASSCTDDITSDGDNDGVIDCIDLCSDVDHDDFGSDGSATIVGAGSIAAGSCTTDGASPCAFGDAACAAVDLDDAASSCTDNLSDNDIDGAPDCVDLCLDLDGDGETVDPSTHTIGSGSIPVADCTTDGVTPCTFGGPGCTPGADCDDDPVTGPTCTSGCITYRRDADGDGFSDWSVTRAACTLGTGWMQGGFQDEDDNASSCTTSLSDYDDGDGVPTCLDLCRDVDGDDYGDGMAGFVFGSGDIAVGDCTTDGVTPCVHPDSACLGTDCDDGNSCIWAACATCADLDHDGSAAGACDSFACAPGGTGDCNDGDPAVFSGAPEFPDDGAIQTCGGVGLVRSAAIGIHVDTSNGTDNGTCGAETSPCRTLTQALARAQAEGKAIFLAAGTYNDAQLTLDVSLFGGYEPSTWTRDIPSQTTIVRSAEAGHIVAGPAIAIEGITFASQSSPILRLEPGVIVVRQCVVAGSPTSSFSSVRGLHVQGSRSGRAVVLDSEVSVSGDGVHAYGIYLDGRTPLVLHNSSVTAQTSGGSKWATGIYVGGTLFAFDNAINGGTGSYTRGLSIYGSALLVGNIIDGGSASSTSSYGFELTYGDLIAINNVIKGGVSDGNTVAAGLSGYYGSAGVATLINNVILGGSSTTGSPIGLWINSESATVINNIIENTMAVPDFRFIYLGLPPDASVTVLNSAFAGSTGSDCMIWNNGAGGCISDNTVAGVNACSAEWSPCSAANGNTVCTPDFVDPAGGDFRLQATSTCMDQGTEPTSYYDGPDVYLDIDGVTRPQGSGWDIGINEQ